MKIYLLRHGRTLWNEQGRLQGRADVPLSGEGRAAARRTGEALRGVPFSAAFSSPLLRARETAELILGDRPVPVTADARLLELDFGVLEGAYLKDVPEAARPTARLFAAPETEYRPPEGGETYEALTARCRAFLREVIAPGEKLWEHVLIVAHGGTVRGLFSAMFGPAAREIYGDRVQQNCAVNVIGFTGGVFTPDSVARAYCAGEV